MTHSIPRCFATSRLLSDGDRELEIYRVEVLSEYQKQNPKPGNLKGKREKANEKARESLTTPLLYSAIVPTLIVKFTLVILISSKPGNSQGKREKNGEKAHWAVCHRWV